MLTAVVLRLMMMMGGFVLLTGRQSYADAGWLFCSGSNLLVFLIQVV